MSQSNKEEEKARKLWHLYGNTYDLTSFMKKHPGGEDILLITQDHQDITPMFESYHAFADFEKYKEDLETYRVGESEYEQLYTYKKGDFYDTVRSRVREYFGKGKNVNDKVKINNFWFIKVSILTFAYLFNLVMAFANPNISSIQSCIHATFAGSLLICVGMCVFHDSSHFALFRRNFAKNDVFTRIVGAFLMWRSELWLMHHSFRHHAYTGNENLDPDILNYHPFIRKTDRVDKKKYMKFPHNLLPYFASFVLWVFPGQCVGQMTVYWLMWQRRGYIWKMKLPKCIMRRTVYENVILFLVLFMHIYRFNIFVSFCYLTALNISYAIAIIPDHDTFSTHQNFDSSKKDWGETQVRNSGNFVNKKYFDIYNHVFGGINYQIEHHLFPSMCGVHLNKISPIVQETCKEFNIPYVSQPSITAAYKDFLKSISGINY